MFILLIFLCFHAACVGAEVFQPSVLLSPSSAGLRRHHPISFLIPGPFCCQKSHKSFQPSPFWKSPFTSCSTVAFDCPSVPHRVWAFAFVCLLFVPPNAIWSANSSHSYCLVTQCLEESMFSTSQAAVAPSFREKALCTPCNPRHEQLWPPKSNVGTTEMLGSLQLALGTMLYDMSPSLLHQL